MSLDALAVLRSTDSGLGDALRARGLHVRALGDGALLVNTMMSFAGFDRDRVGAAQWLRALGPLARDPRERRGVLFIPETASPPAGAIYDSYDAVVTATEAVGFWVDPDVVIAEAVTKRAAEIPADIAALAQLSRRLQAEPDTSIDELLKEDWPPVVRAQLLQLQALHARKK